MDIQKAAEDFARFEASIGNESIYERTYNAYLAGAYYQRNSVWHDTKTDEPDEEKDLLLMYCHKDGSKSFNIGLYGNHSKSVYVPFRFGFHWLKITHYDKWAYLSDILPTNK